MYLGRYFRDLSNQYWYLPNGGGFTLLMNVKGWSIPESHGAILAVG